jgi:hypothetical protein
MSRFPASKTYGKSLFFNTGWTWAKDLTDTQNNGSGFAGPTIQNAYDRRTEKGDNVLTRPQRVYINAIYALPFGKDQRFLSSSNRIVGRDSGRVEHVMGFASALLVRILNSAIEPRRFNTGAGSKNPRQLMGHNLK